MTRPVSVVLPSLDDLDLLEAGLPPLLEELERRGQGDEVVIVDDTGRNVLGPALAERFGTVRVLAMEKNGGYAAALLAGMRAAQHPLVFSMNPDVRVRPGFLDPLVACLAEPEVAAVVPRVLLGGQEERIESLTYLEEKAGLLVVDQPGLGDVVDAPRLRLGSVAFAIGGACLLRRDEFLESGGFDPLFEPFYWEDVDWGWQQWRAGRCILYQPASVVEHHHRGTIGRRLGADFVRAVIERNRLLFTWKHAQGREFQRRHLAACHRWALDAYLADRREDLVWLAFALDRVEQALAARRALPGGMGTNELIDRVRPSGD
jgi:GT2 family glycosyltransferase